LNWLAVAVAVVVVVVVVSILDSGILDFNDSV
jgi:hypothetical protein